ncbi:hypothetical protein WME98_37615 [Sorangium sp. So ce296]|uniref:hypothetical protein n=1 Tax=Sorangium sp. So ce296 TaxID=3133296 RepID=UPI003F5DCB5C
MVPRPLASLALVSVLLAPRALRAQLPCFPGTCPPPAPAAPARPPPLTPEVELATRARLEAEARPRLEPQARATAAQQVHDERRRAWIERGVEREPNPVRIRLPLLEVSAAGRMLATFGKDAYAQEGVGLGARLRPGEPLAVEIAAAYASLDAAGVARVGAVTLEPSAVFLWGRRDRIDLYLRSGLEVTLPFDDGARPPEVMLGGHVGLGFQFRAARIGRGGFVGWFLEGRGLVRGGLGGAISAMRGPHAGVELLFGPSVGF